MNFKTLPTEFPFVITQYVFFLELSLEGGKYASVVMPHKKMRCKLKIWSFLSHKHQQLALYRNAYNMFWFNISHNTLMYRQCKL